ncbi:MAG: hypothetical protein AB8B67_04025 [Rickettsiaceae bacterium]
MKGIDSLFDQRSKYLTNKIKAVNDALDQTQKDLDILKNKDKTLSEVAIKTKDLSSVYNIEKEEWEDKTARDELKMSRREEKIDMLVALINKRRIERETRNEFGSFINSDDESVGSSSFVNSSLLSSYDNPLASPISFIPKYLQKGVSVDLISPIKNPVLDAPETIEIDVRSRKSSGFICFKTNEEDINQLIKAVNSRIKKNDSYITFDIAGQKTIYCT